MQNFAFNRVLWICGICCFASMACLRACDSILPALASDFNVSMEQAARTISLFALAYGLMLAFVGPLGDRFGKLRVIALATLICGAGSLIAATSTDLRTLLLSRITSGAAAAGIIPLTMAWVGDNITFDRRQEVLARVLGITVLGMIAGQWLSALLTDTFGWRFVFFLLALVLGTGGVLAILTARKLSHLVTAETLTVSQRVRTVFEAPAARRILILTFAEGIFAFGALAFIPSFLHSEQALSMSQAGAVVAAFGLGGLAYTRSSKHILAYLSKRRLSLIAGACLAAGYGLLSASSHWQSASVACFIAGFGFHMLHNILQTYATQMAPKARGTAVSLFSCVLFLGQSLGISAAAWLVPHASLQLIFICSGAGLLGIASFVSLEHDHRAA